MSKIFAATTPSLGLAASFGILSSTYTNTVGGTTINGDLGYTTGPATAPTVSGTTHIANGTYSQAGTDQGSALTALAAESCTFTFASGAIDLATDTTHGPIGVYTPGVYCTAAASAASIGAAGITLSGSGTYIFRINGALTTVANSVVTSSGASACDVFWTPTGATTLGANSTFFGTNIDDSGITIGSTVTWEGRALAFGGTISTTSDTITVPTCSTPTPTATATPTSTPTPTTTSSSSSSSTSFSSSGASICISSGITTIPSILEARRVSSTSVFVSWGPNAGLDDFIVQYGFQNGNWQFNTPVSGFSTTINDLPVNQAVWIKVAATDNCATGTYSAPRLIGGLTTFIPGFPDTGGIPLLPDTGYGPN